MCEGWVEGDEFQIIGVPCLHLSKYVRSLGLYLFLLHLHHYFIMISAVLCKYTAQHLYPSSHPHLHILCHNLFCSIFITSSTILYLLLQSVFGIILISMSIILFQNFLHMSAVVCLKPPELVTFTFCLYTLFGG